MPPYIVKYLLAAVNRHYMEFKFFLVDVRLATLSLSLATSLLKRGSSGCVRFMASS